MRLAVLAMVLCACSAKLAPGQGDEVDAARAGGDAAVVVDAPIDARPCAGGDAHTSEGSNCFVYFQAPKLWVDAKAACEAMQAHLAIVTSAAQETAIESIATGLDTYLGATDAQVEGTFLWSDGTPLTYTHWRANEPNNGNGLYQEDCVVFTRKTTGGWDDRPCAPPPVASGSYAYLCEY